ncbi:uncharacterized protein LOC127264714 [Andrographis paniculata]|uniref:uncharacterized protein LOC127264714 n=1 Tax=Andrographis paniculata TaxID=175694 RepID=UPI0021E7484F|nr:uncharacterized protein LOC127264714 [Andrographis paniculata]
MGCTIILVVVDRLSKYAEFIPAPKECTVEMTAKLFTDHVVKYWGLPTSIINDRDSQFTKRFWMELFRLFGSELKVSMMIHPQTDGQTECVNHVLEVYLRLYVMKNESTGKSPFKIVLGFQPMTLKDLEGPFPVRKKVGEVAYKVELSEALSQLHPVFHTSLLKPYREDVQDPNQNESTRAPSEMRMTYDKVAKEIVVDRVVRHKNRPPSTEYLVK